MSRKRKQEPLDNLQDDEEIKSIYLNNDYIPIDPNPLETIYESSTNKRRVNNDLVLGQNRANRKIEPSRHWVEDKAKTKQRRKMTNKSAKLSGKKRYTWRGLTEQQEEKLKDIVEINRLDIDENDENEDDLFNNSSNKMSFSENTLMETQSSSLELDKSSQDSNSSSNKSKNTGDLDESFETPTFTPKAKKNRRRSSMLRRVLLPSTQATSNTFIDSAGNNVLICEGSSQSTGKVESPFNNSLQNEQLSIEKKPVAEKKTAKLPVKKSNSKLKVSLSPPEIENTEESFGFTPTMPTASKEEFLKEIEQADSFLGAIDLGSSRKKTETSTKSKKSSRNSIVRNVRRSSRLLRITPQTSSSSHSSYGSTYQSMEFPMK